MAYLEHVNLTSSDPDRFANLMCDLFGWKIRWRGDATQGGHTIHVGEETSYIAVYTKGVRDAAMTSSYETPGGLNHIAVVVDDLDATEEKVKAAGYVTENHGDYEPGRRFYFREDDGIEIEIVSYA